ncbi:MAG: type II secretion system F family protein, partial [Dehalococcoidia bacterium]|nr:type II secretion system F family protein [Dehalococcoidia bacterium]
KVTTKEIILFSRQLATLLDAGISIVPALELMLEEMNSRAFKRVVARILEGLRAGDPFSEALSRHDQVFGELYCQLVAVSERTGGVPDSLRQAAAYMEKDAITKKKIKKALTYPVIVLSVAVVVMGLLIVFVMPKMTSMFTAMDVELPITTRLMIFVTDFVTGNILALLLGAALAGLAAFLYVRRPAGLYQFHRLLLALPVIGKANLMGEMARFSRTLALLIHAGLPLPEILEMARRTSGNVVVKEALAEVRTGLVQGDGLSGPMSRNRVFPRLLVQMVVVGEESGRLESTLDTVASAYETEAEDRIAGMVAMIEPAMTLFLAVVIGVIALSVITPMYSLTDAFK